MKKVKLAVVITILLSASLHVGTASATEYEAEVLSLTNNIDPHMFVGGADVAWNGFYYKIAYMYSDGQNWPEDDLIHHIINWATIDSEGNIVDVQPLIDNPEYSAQNPCLIPIKMYIQPKYILLWVEARPGQFFKKLHASIIDEDGNMLSDKIISPYINSTMHPVTYEFGTYAAVWDNLKKVLYLVYAEGNPRVLYGGLNPNIEKLVFCKLYKTGNNLNFVTFLFNNSLTRKKVLFPDVPKIGRIAMVKTPQHLAVAASAEYPIPFMLLDLNGNIITESSNVYGIHTSWPTLYWDGQKIILGCLYSDFFDKKYQIKKVAININNNGLEPLFVQKTVEIDDIDFGNNPALLRKYNDLLSFVWKDQINGIKAIYTTGLDKDLNFILTEQALEPPYIQGGLSDLYLIDGTTKNIEFALVYRSLYFDYTPNLLRYDFIPIEQRPNGNDGRR